MGLSSFLPLCLLASVGEHASLSLVRARAARQRPLTRLRALDGLWKPRRWVERGRLSLELGYEAIGLPREGPRGPRALRDRARKPWGKAPEKVAQRLKRQLKARRPNDDGPQEGSRRASRRLEAGQRPKGQLMHRACGPHAVPAPSRMLVRAGRWVERARLSPAVSRRWV